jgi:hypothetical protein
LKVRFGESALQVCEVMLKDMTDSQRIDQHIQSQKAVCNLLQFRTLPVAHCVTASLLYIRPSYPGISGQRWSRQIS